MQSSSKMPVIKSPPGHSRNRIACTRCRRRKIKCITDKKSPTTPCERCVKEGATCEYVTASCSDDERMSPQPGYTSRSTVWVEPLDPESYARSSNAPSPVSSQSRRHDHEFSPSVHGGHSTAPEIPMMPPFQYDNRYSVGAYTQPPSIPGVVGLDYPAYQQCPPPARNGNRNGNVNSLATAPLNVVHYGPFPGPAGTIYPWSQQQQQQQRTRHYTNACSCHPGVPCLCGRRVF